VKTSFNSYVKAKDYTSPPNVFITSLADILKLTVLVEHQLWGKLRGATTEICLSTEIEFDPPPAILLFESNEVHIGFFESIATLGTQSTFNVASVRIKSFVSFLLCRIVCQS